MSSQPAKIIKFGRNMKHQIVVEDLNAGRMEIKAEKSGMDWSEKKDMDASMHQPSQLESVKQEVEEEDVEETEQFVFYECERVQTLKLENDGEHAVMENLRLKEEESKDTVDLKCENELFCEEEVSGNILIPERHNDKLTVGTDEKIKLVKKAGSKHKSDSPQNGDCKRRMHQKDQEKDKVCESRPSQAQSLAGKVDVKLLAVMAVQTGLSEMELSETCRNLDQHHQELYRKKIKCLGLDPYTISREKFTSFKDWLPKPDLGYGDLYHYLVNTPSKFSGASLKAYKSLEAYSLFVAGWVRDVVIAPLQNTDLSVIKAQVSHSQRLSEPPLRPWVAVHQDGIVETSHCTCMDGLCETCSHVAAVLFAVECRVRLSEGKTCTDVPCAWNQPASSSTSIEFATLNDIDFTNPKKKQRMSAEKKVHVRQQTQSRVIPAPTDEEKQALYRTLYETGQKCGVLSLVEPYNQDYILQVAHTNCPKPLDTLHNPRLQTVDFDVLLEECSQLQQLIKVTPEQVQFVEEATRKKSKCSLWYQQRIGRITASTLWDVTRTDIEKPSRSLLNKICYPKITRFSTKATRWGCDHKVIARKDYEETNKHLHQDLKVGETGLVLSQRFPYLGASPDGYVSCFCCGGGIIEFKCLFCHKDETLEDSADSTQFCLENVGEKLQLKKTHRCYYQIQTQLAVTEAKYCDFVVWTEKGIHIERVKIDSSFFHGHACKAAEYQKRVVLPELVAKWFSRNPQLCSMRTHKKVFQQRDPDVGSVSVICYCRKVPDNKPMVICKSGFCKIVQFHLRCMGLKHLPKRRWLCIDCRKLERNITLK